MGKSESVVSRKISRNKDGRNGEYRHDLAQRKYESRRANTPKHIRFTERVKSEVKSLLKQDYSPEQVSGFHKEESKDCVSPERIYQHVWDNKKRKEDLYLHLRRQGRQYKKRGNTKDNRGIIKDKVGIDKRPAIVEKKNGLTI